MSGWSHTYIRAHIPLARLSLWCASLSLCFSFIERRPTAKPQLSTLERMRASAIRKVNRHKDLFLTVPTLALALLLLGLVVWPYQNLSLPFEGWLVLVVMGLLLVFLVSEVAPPPTLFLLGLVTMVYFGALSTSQAFEGFGNSDVITIAALYSFSEGIKRSTLLLYVVKYVLGRPASVLAAQLRLVLPVMCMSTVLSNTSIVGILVPVVNSWSAAIGVPKARLHMNLGFAAILGGCFTLIGSSSNLLVASLASSADPPIEVGFLAPAIASFVNAVPGAIYLIFGAKYLLPHEDGDSASTAAARSYLTPVRIREDSSLDAVSLGNSGLNSIEGVAVTEVHRDNHVTVMPEETFKLRGGDVLICAGPIRKLMRELFPAQGLEVVVAEHAAKLPNHPTQRRLFNAVVARESRLVGHTPADVMFRQRYHAAILAVHRRGAMVPRDLSSLIFEVGDGLLLEALPSFPQNTVALQDFIGITEVGRTSVLEEGRPLHAAVALFSIIFVVVASAFRLMSTSLAVITSTGFLVLCRILSVSDAFAAISLKSVSVIAISLAFSTAMVQNDVADNLANTLLDVFSLGGDVGVLLGIFVTTSLLATLISPQAAVSLVFPIAVSIPPSTEMRDVELMANLIIASNCAFMTQWCRSSNLMVADSGGYSTTNFLVYGLPLTIMMPLLTVAVLYYGPFDKD
eukprot:TRINITY_DN1634_c0_g1_i6.p1 TRINITY_DN1634_c0_g1~~TRINITY_DN1634_c0_g1_i6.p1  ORF type:complete len:685 (-),score=101.40 TRINITY_DN1634_c0_g1_i6:127-2181(-)